MALSRLPMSMMIARTNVEAKPGAPVIRIRRAVIDRRSIIRISIHWWSIGRVHLGLLIHVEINLFGDMILRTKPVTRAEKSDLLKLVG